MANTTAQIKLIKKVLDQQQIDWLKTENQLCYPITIELMSNVDFDNQDAESDPDFGYKANILVLRLSGLGFDPVQGDVFVKVADVSDLYELANEENFQQMNNNSDEYKTSYYRVNKITLACRSEEEVNHVWEGMQSEVKQFINNFNLQYQLETANDTQLNIEEVII